MLAALTGEPVPAREDIDAKKQLILRHGLALWDTLERCTITGASDASIRDVVPNDIAALLAKDTFRNIKRSFDSTEIGGAPLLGVEGAVIKAHGNSNARAIFCAIRQAKSMVDGGVVDVIREEVAKLSVEDEKEE